MKELSENNVREQLSVLLGLASKKGEDIETCPSPQQLALFIDGQLKKKSNKLMLAHLNQCEDCRSIWLETASYIESKPDLKETSIGQKIIQGIGNFLTPKPLIIGGITATLLFILTIMPGSQVDQKIESEYESLASLSNREVADVAKLVIMPWDNSVMAFGKTNSDAKKNAFGSGLWQGKNRLITSSQPLPSKLTASRNGHWQKSDWNSYYQFGRLVVLLWVETKLTKNDTDWDKYEKILSQLHESLTEDANFNEITQAIEQITRKIKVLKTNKQQNIVEKKPLQRLLEIIMQKFSPG